MKSKVTIKEVAARAGVGLGTVSRVLNHSPSVKESTRKKVLDAAGELNYIPNGAARMLVRRSETVATVGLFLPIVENQYFFELIKFIHRRLKTEHINIMIFNTDYGQDSVMHHIIEQRLAGVLTLGDPPLTEAEQHILKTHDVPFLYVDYHDERANFITYDNFAGSRAAADFLLSKGCRKIMMIGLIDHSHQPLNRSQQQLDRFQGFRERVREQEGIQLSELCINGEEESYDITRSLLNDPELDGLFYFSDIMAYGGMQAKMEMGRNVLIIGYDDIFPSRFMKLNTIRQSSEILGTQAAEIILELMKRDRQSEGAPLVQRILQPELIDRNS